MGLDMYLSAKSTYSDYFAKETYDAVAQAVGMPEELDLKADTKSVTVEFDVAYWRKAYAINDWFNQNLLDVDNGRSAWVSIDTLRELRDWCKEQIENPEDDVDGYDIQQYEYTVNVLNHICDNIAYNSFEYYYTISY